MHPAAAPARLEVQVFGQRELESRVARGDPVRSHLVSITDPRQADASAPGPRSVDDSIPEALRGHFRRALSLVFSDCLPEEARDGRRAPDLDDARRLLAFVEDTVDEADGYTVHCRSGISRSAAVALAILYVLRGSEDAAVRELMRIRHIAQPHPGLVSCFDELLGSKLASCAGAMRDERLKVIRERVRIAAGREPGA
jgi:predicted protein tyrosine phosphatase